MFKILDEVLQSRKGMWLQCSSPGTATNRVYRLRAARRLDMRQAELVNGDPETSIYTCLLISRDEADKCRVLIKIVSREEADGFMAKGELE